MVVNECKGGFNPVEDEEEALRKKKDQFVMKEGHKVHGSNTNDLEIQAIGPSMV